MLSEVLFDLALKLEEPANLSIDVEHVLAATVLTASYGDSIHLLDQFEWHFMGGIISHVI
ncbi:hypothetical protein [Thalassoglobus sp.]|uniref:hypothetical protein n=1 Tax=Thalassoglobus sp. TaxID=2795869 RepID=UPI003AA9AEB3